MGLYAQAQGKARDRSTSRRRGALALCAAALGLAALAPTAANASFHEIKVREVFPGAGNTSYVEVQMYNAGQNFVGAKSLLTVYDSTGTAVHTSPTFSGNVSKNVNQSFILIGDTSASGSPDLVDSGLDLSAAAGAVCWNAGGAPSDCVSWGGGAFTGSASLPSPGAGTPAPAITAGKAIRRSIAPGCATLLEASDDSNSSATDFSEVDPAPHNNAFTPSEMACAGAPNTVIDTKPPAQTNSTTATFTFHSEPVGAGFECNLDEAGFGACPANYTSLAEGDHEFEVRAVSGAMQDPSPATYAWKVDLTPPTAVIDTQPADPSSGASPKFTFHSDPGSTFQCSLVKVGSADVFAACGSPKTFSTLTQNGEYVFKVKAKDPATNQGSEVSYKWNVDTSLGDTTDPETTLLTKPPDPSTSTTAAFTYESNEPNSTFECKLDSGAFEACPATGKSYAGLAAGPHTFQVIAIDSSNNKDESPAGWSFSIVLTPPEEEKKPPPPPPPAPAPDTKVTGKPAAKSSDRTPTVKFSASIGGATFQCKIDGGPFKACRSPLTTKALSFGKHTIKIRATAGGLTDPTPAQVSFKIVKKKKR